MKREKQKIVEFIQSYLKGVQKSKVVLGLSGGLDSAAVATLATEALGNENVYAAILPYKNSDPKNIEDALNLVKKLQINHEVIDISPYVDTYFFDSNLDSSILRKGNFMARIRMCILFDLSAKYNALVIGTENRSELLTGYFTQNGDNASAFEPIGHLYKTEVFELAKTLNVAAEIIDKKPSADLWQGQTDEDEMGISYEVLDPLLHLIVDKNMGDEQIMYLGFENRDIERVKELYQQSAFKRKMPPTIEETAN